MSFYNLLQLDPAVLKPKIRSAKNKKERFKLINAMALRSILIVLFSIAFIAPLSNIFGSENSPMLVALFCILLGVRFVDFGYCIKDSMLNLGIVFLLLLFAPIIASSLNPVLAICVHFLAFFTILFMTCDKPELGNGGLFSFAYVYLSGNPVTGHMLWNRFMVTLIGYILCGAIFYFKHREKNKDIRFFDVAAKFDISKEKNRWEIRLALGTALVLSLASFLKVKRFMWVGFACASMMSNYPYSVKIEKRVIDRVGGVVIGSILYLGICKIMPESFYSLLGPLGGLCLGFSTKYSCKNAINCFGALMMATELYGVQGAVMLRVFDNILGVIFAFIFVLLFRQLVDKRFEKDIVDTKI